MKHLLILFVSVVFTQSLEVDGDLTVTGQIQSQTIDALGGMKPERIYRYETLQAGFSFTVPNNKIWKVHIIPDNSGNHYVNYNNNTIIVSQDGGSSSSFVMFSGDILSENSLNHAIINIYEYSIWGSGTSQGMDYIEP